MRIRFSSQPSKWKNRERRMGSTTIGSRLHALARLAGVDLIRLDSVRHPLGRRVRLIRSLGIDLVLDVLERRAASAARDDSRKRAAALHRHVADYLIPRAASLEAPLAVVIMGSTGAGKSSLFNALAGKRVSASGVLRPTTREPVLLAAPEDAAALETDTDRGAWARRAQLRIVADAEAGRRGLLLIDAPDIDSVESANRELAAELLEAADLVVYVTTASRYADQVPWQMLERARERGVPLLAVLNRLPPEQADAASVREDHRRLLERGRLAESGAFGALEVVSVVEGEVDAERDALAADAVAPVRAALDHLVRDQDARRELARRALAASLGALPPQLSGIAGEMDAEAEAGDRLLAIASRAYAARRAALGEEIGGGTFLRTEVLREWQAFVGAGRVTQLLTRGIGRITAGNAFEPESTFSDVLAAADVLLVSERASAIDMSLPSKLTSYFAAGRPVLAAVSPGGATAREVQRSGGGVLVPAGQPHALLDAVLRLQGDHGLARRVCEAAAAYATESLGAEPALLRAEQFIERLMVAPDCSPLKGKGS